jgi:hypothetical protein
MTKESAWNNSDFRILWSAEGWLITIFTPKWCVGWEFLLSFINVMFYGLFSDDYGRIGQ